MDAVKLDSLFIAGIGSYLPPIVDCMEAVRHGWCDEATCLEDGWLGAAVADDMSPCEMAVRAGEVALSRARMEPREIDILFHAWSNDQGPHIWLPQVFVERHLIGRDIPAIGIWQGCVGVWTSAELAACYLLVPGRESAIVTGADNWGFDPVVGMDPSFRWKYALGARTSRASVLGDAGVAMVLSRRKGFARVLAIGSRSLSELEEAYRGGEPLFPPEAGTERPVRLGGRIRAYADLRPAQAAALGRLLNDARTALALDVLSEAQLKPEDIARVLHVHAGNSGYIKHILDPLGIEADKGMLEFGRRIGHLAAGDQVAALEHLLTTEQIGQGDRVLIMANGVGASLSSAVVEIDERPNWKTADSG
jgi:3-oxoacyl-[acyl-carrier-protein] synthase-3